MEQILSIFSNGWSIAAVVTLFGVILNIIMKKYITSDFLSNVSTKIYDFGEGLGIAITLGLSRIPYLKILWNNTIEPYVIIILDLVTKSFIDGLVMGMESDNNSTKQEDEDK
jgi:hypothetical protein